MKVLNYDSNVAFKDSDGDPPVEYAVSAQIEVAVNGYVLTLLVPEEGELVPYTYVFENKDEMMKTLGSSL